MNRYQGSKAPRTSFTVSTISQLEQLLLYLGRKGKARYIRIRSLLANPPANPQEARTIVFAQAISPLNVLILLWILVLCWGEIWAFDNSVRRCDWNRWEKWPSDAIPHHIAFVADPQLVDPHTYPGRPWPLSTLTIKHTDLYMRRAYSRIQQQLDPNTILFLGDLFDGGREWATAKSHSPERRFRKYDEEFWLNEFERFSAIFLREWKTGVRAGRDRRDGRRIIASLPGNHDLGFGRGIQKPVRDRFNTFFGDGNRLDIIGNHTFVSLDTVSLSAAEQPAAEYYEEIWRPPQDFMKAFETNRATAIARHLRHLHDNPHINPLNEHVVLDIDSPKIVAKDAPPSESPPTDGFPTVLLTHVPLYRMKGEPCGPHREHDPPVPPPPGQKEPFSPDDPNSIPLSGGYQYQNVISGQITSIIAQNLGGSIEYVFSGDDHDYCEVVHRSYPNPGAGIREVTVKTISEAMGVRKPGFVLASLWNPIDSDGHRIKSTSSNANGKTLQSHLCLLPDEVGIVIKYAVLLVVSLIFLFLRAVTHIVNRSFGHSPTIANSLNSILSTLSSSFYANFSPPSSPSAAEKEKRSMNGGFSYPRPASAKDAHNPKSSTSSSSEDNSAHLSVRPNRARSSSPLPSYTQDIDVAGSSYAWNATQPHDGDDEPSFAYAGDRRMRSQNPPVDVFFEWIASIWYVARVVVAWYLVLFNWW